MPRLLAAASKEKCAGNHLKVKRHLSGIDCREYGNGEKQRGLTRERAASRSFREEVGVVDEQGDLLFSQLPALMRAVRLSEIILCSLRQHFSEHFAKQWNMFIPKHEKGRRK